MYLRKAYGIALQRMNQNTWIQCINVALSELNDNGYETITNSKTIRTWNVSFRKTETFQVSFLKNPQIV